MKRSRTLCLSIALSLLAACRSLPDPTGAEASPTDERRAAVEHVLDAFHQAASDANGERYFELMTEDAVFLGTDATERWTRDAFRDYAMPYFEAGRGWTYRTLERHVHLAPAGDSAWFDERLWNDKYGECRGTGVLLRRETGWKVAQYNLTFPVPNEIAGEVVEQIKRHTGAAR